FGGGGAGSLGIIGAVTSSGIAFYQASTGQVLTSSGFGGQVFPSLLHSTLQSFFRSISATSFFGGTPPITNPHILFDPGSFTGATGQWIVTALQQDPTSGDTMLLIGVNPGGNPSGSWTFLASDLSLDGSGTTGGTTGSTTGSTTGT